jgi:ankyrin repeat protein
VRRRVSRRSTHVSSNRETARTATQHPFSARLRIAGALLIAAGIPLLLFLGYLALPVFWRGNQGLYEAIGSHDLARVQMLLNHGADPNSRSRGFQFLRLRASDRRRYFDDPPLILAIQLRQSEIAAALIAHGADVHARDAQGTPALTLAKRQGQAALVGLLLERGAREE